MTKEQKRITKTGILFVVVLFITIWGINYIRSNDLITSKTKLFAVYSNVKELTEGNHVFLSGTKIGKVSHVDFVDGNLNKLVVEFHVRNDIKIPDSSVAMISNIDIMGTMGIKIIVNENTKGFYKTGDTLLSKVERSLQEQVNKQILPLKLKTESMISTVDSLLVAFRSVFNPETRTNIKKSFAHIQATLKNLESTTLTLDTLMTSEKRTIALILKNAESITTNLANNNENINNIIENFSDISDSLTAANFTNVIKQAELSLTDLSNIMDKVNKGEGTLGLLLKDEELYNKLNNSSESLDKLLIDIKKNPTRYVRFSAINFGRKIIVTKTDSTDNKKN